MFFFSGVSPCVSHATTTTANSSSIGKFICVSRQQMVNFLKKKERKLFPLPHTMQTHIKYTHLKSFLYSNNVVADCLCFISESYFVGMKKSGRERERESGAWYFVYFGIIQHVRTVQTTYMLGIICINKQFPFFFVVIFPFCLLRKTHCVCVCVCARLYAKNLSRTLWHNVF